MKRAALAMIMILIGLPATAQVSFDFEDGTLQGWTVVEGDVGPQPSDKSDDRHHGNFNKQGRYFVGTFEFKGDDATGVLRSPTFTIGSDMISLLVGGGNNPDTVYVALCRASDGEVLFKETGSNAEAMTRRYWDTSALKGTEVYVLIVDKAQDGWGHINVDDVREMTRPEIREREMELRRAQEERERWYNALFDPAERKVYRGDELADITFEMGGIGAGNIGVAGDGSLRHWQIFNVYNPNCDLPWSFSAIWAQAAGDAPVARALQSVPEGTIPPVAATECTGEFPVPEWTYTDPDLPVQVTMEAFSPFIPMDPRDSALPATTYTFTIHNPGDEEVRVSIAAALQNAVGYDGRATIDGVSSQGFGGNVNRATAGDGFWAIVMTNPSLDPADKHFGTMTVGAIVDEAQSLAQWDDPMQWWEEFADSGTLPQATNTDLSPQGRTWNGVIAAPLTVPPGEERKVTYFITWHFPNFYADYNAHLAKYRLGNMYSNWYGDALDAAEYLVANFDRLSSETHLYRDTLFDTTLPYWMIYRIASQANTLCSQVQLWIEDGTFAAFEGAWCCPMNCTHVYDYEMTCAHLFPSLDRNVRETDLTLQLMPNGGVHHRTELPAVAPRRHVPFVDGQLGTILKAYREHLRSADCRWLDKMWPRIRRAMDFVIRDWDPNKDGVLVMNQLNTYDAGMYGPNTFIGSMYLAALRASEEMARIEGEPDLADSYHHLFETGSKRLDEACWNGEYWIHIMKKEPDLAEKGAWLFEDWPPESEKDLGRPYGIGCHADQLLGQWWASILDLGYVLPQDRVRTALASIMKYDWRDDYADVPQQRYFAGAGDRGLLCCTWPHDGRPSPAILYADEVWTGIEYEVAGLCINEDMLREGYQIVKAVDERYNGAKRPPIPRNPWSEIECGEHYARGMSSWSVLLAAQGFTYNGPEGIIGFAPRVTPEDHRSFFTTAEGWGTFTQTRDGRRQTDSLKLVYGSTNLRILQLQLPDAAAGADLQVRVTHSRGTVPVTVAASGTEVTLTLGNAVELTAGSALTVVMEW